MQQRTAAIGPRVTRPQKQEHAQRVNWFKGSFVGHGVVLEGEHIEQTESQGHINLRRKGISPILERVGLLQVEFAHQHIND